jgi:DNA replicative helicase MCM subunit Mcm2 (Cdc46/Mcm family)
MISQDKGIKIYSVSEAKLIESGQVTITGMIASMSTIYKVISKSEWECSNPTCNQRGSQTYTPALLNLPQHLDNTACFNIKCFKCGSTAFTVKHTYHNARTIQIEDINKTDDIDRLEVVVYDEASQCIIAGEAVDLTGDLYIQRKIDGVKGKKLVTILHSNIITYKNKEKIIVTEKDIENFHRWKKICDTAYQKEIEAVRRNENWSKKIKPMTFVNRLVAMFAPNVIGYNDKKLGLLRSLVGGRADNGNDNGRRGRINTLLVGDPATAKSLLAREATRITPNSRFVSAQNASGKSLVAIVDKENDSLVLRLGAIVLAKGSICAINEIGSMSLDDQQHLIDIAEEGRCTVDKYGTHFEIDSPTTIVATANPYNTTWSKAFSMTKDEIPTLKTLLDRCDQIYGFTDAPSEEEVKEYSKQKTIIRKRKPHNYNFLKKFLIYIKISINPKLTNDAEDRLNKFWIKAKIEGTATNRTYDSIFRLAEAQARLNFSSEINDDIATQIMDSASMMLSQYGKVVETIESPRDITYRAFFYTLKHAKAGLSVYELCKIACEENKQVSEYLGNKLDMEHNHKIKPVIDMLLNNHSKAIKIVKVKPMVLQYIEEKEEDDSIVSDISDVSDNANNIDHQEKHSDKKIQTMSVASDRSVLHSHASKHIQDISCANTSSKRSTISLDIDEQIRRMNIIQTEKEFPCVYCDFKTKIETEYERHIVNKHPDHLPCPTENDLHLNGGRIKRSRNK